MFAWFMFQSCVKEKKLCIFNYWLFVAFLAAFIWCGEHMTKQAREEMVQIDHMMQHKCDGNLQGLMGKFDTIYAESAQVFCTPKCPCNIVQSDSNFLSVDLNAGRYNIQKCESSSLAELN